MQRVKFPELQGRPRRRHRKQPHTDRVVLGLKIATFVAAGGLLGVVVLLAGSGQTDRSAAPQATPPTSAPGTSGDDAYEPRQRQTDPPPVIAPPAVQTESSTVAPKPKPAATQAPKAPAQAAAPQAEAVQSTVPTIGARCDRPGTFAITGSFQPVVCRGNSPTDPPRWHFPF